MGDEWMGRALQIARPRDRYPLASSCDLRRPMGLESRWRPVFDVGLAETKRLPAKEFVEPVS